MRLTRIKRQFLLLCISSCLFSSFLWVFLMPALEDSKGTEWTDFNLRTEANEKVDVTEDAEDEKGKVVILMWSNYYERKGDQLMELINRGKDYDQNCCEGVEVTLDREELERATAIVIFHYFGNLNISDLPKTRRPDQPWVLFGKESPRFSPGLKPFNKLFNWTMSYRTDSDIFAPYGEYLPLDKEIESIKVSDVPLDIFIGRKSGLLAGVISNCHTPGKREEFIKRLKIDGNMSVDIFGGCGKKICGRLNTKCDHNKWWGELAAKYKFYFAAENAVCTDYITEKFWRTLQIGMVPLVYGGGNYTRFAPPNSYIDVKNFKSVKDIGEYLKKIGEDNLEYKKYFAWRKKYQVKIGECWQGWCDLCKKVKDFRTTLDENNNPIVLEELSRTIDDLGGWWSHAAGGKGDACKNPPFKTNKKLRITPKQTKVGTSFSIQEIMSGEVIQLLKQNDRRIIRYIWDNVLLEPPSELKYNLKKPNKDPSMGQSLFIRKLLKDMKGGFFVECGALDGETRSNTLYLEKSLGWKGLLVEGDPKNYGLMKQKHRKAWISNTCLAVKPFPHHARFMQSFNIGKIIDPNNPKAGKGRQVTVIQCIPLYTLLSALNVTTVDYFSLDVVGSELQVLKTIPFDKLLIKTLSVEFAHTTEGKDELLTFMQLKGYVMLGIVRHPGGLANDLMFAHKSV